MAMLLTPGPMGRLIAILSKATTSSLTAAERTLLGSVLPTASREWNAAAEGEAEVAVEVVASPAAADMASDATATSLPKVYAVTMSVHGVGRDCDDQSV